MSKHALLSPSGSKRWLTCPPSALLESKLPDVSSEYADEGTLAHKLSELLIGYAIGKVSKSKFSIGLQVIKSNKYYSISMHDYCDDFKTYVLERFNQCRAEDPNAILLLETKLDLTKFIPDGFGTADIIIISNGILILIDLKYGQGVPVDCEENPQLMTYGIGAVSRFDCLFDIDIVELHIYQPRIDNTSRWLISVDDLTKWRDNVLVPGAIKAFAGLGDYVAGEHCKFCRAKTGCATLRNFVMDTYKPKLIPGLISPEEVAEVLSKEEIIKEWLNAVANYALQEALEKGTKWPGFKLVEGTSRRIIKDQEEAMKLLQGLKFSKSDYTRTELKPLGELEKLVGKKTLAETFENIIIKPKGKPTLVPVTDKRIELDSAESAFKDIDFETEN